MLSPRAAVLQVVAVLLWAGSVAVTFLVVVYPAVPPGWATALLQLVAYALLAVPAVFLRPLPRMPLGASTLSVVVSALLLTAALVVLTLSGPSIETSAQHVLRAASTGISEELVFRGLLLSRLRVLVRWTPAVALLDGLLFGAYHLPAVLLQHGSPATLLINAGFGVLFTALRLLSKGLLLPTALHIAVDLV